MSGGGIGVLLIQLGTPANPTTPALRRYLAEFLSDRRVIDLPRALWLPILHLRVLRTRPAQSAKLYEKIWTSGGSPLAVTTRAQTASLQQALAGGTTRVHVAMAMRYGQPSIEQALAALRDVADRLLVVPMYPQYAGATTGSSLERVHRIVAGWRTIPAIRTVPPYFAAPAYLDAVTAVARRSLTDCKWIPDHYVVSFHGLPQRYADEGDPYPLHCGETAARLAERLGWPADRVTLGYQSRFGREEWLKPYTDQVLLELAQQKASVAIICPGFVADCLETLEEINITNRRQFVSAGGQGYHYIPCVNDTAAWATGLASIVQRELKGWI